MDPPSPPIRSHTITVRPVIESSPSDGGERLIISNGTQTFQFFWASYERNKRSSPYPFPLDPGKSYTFTVEERPFPPVTLTPVPKDKPNPEEYHWNPVLIRVIDGSKTLFDRELCEVHHCKMERREVAITYGLPLIRNNLPSLDEERALFPHRRDYVLGGCIVMPGKRTETMYICPECKGAFAKWEEAHPQPSE